MSSGVKGKCSKCGIVDCPKDYVGCTIQFLVTDYETGQVYFRCTCGENAYLLDEDTAEG